MYYERLASVWILLEGPSIWRKNISEVSLHKNKTFFHKAYLK